MKLIYIKSCDKYLDIESKLYPSDLYSDADIDFFLKLEIEHAKSIANPNLYNLLEIYPTAKNAAKRYITERIKNYKLQRKELDSHRERYTNEVISTVEDFTDQKLLRENLDTELGKAYAEIDKGINILYGQLSFLKKSIEKEKLEKIIKSKSKSPVEKLLASENLKSIKRREACQLTQELITKAKQVPIDNFVNIKKDNNAMCLFHSEKTASMHINKIKNKYHCFGCGASGSVIDIIMQQYQINFNDAVRKLLNL